MSTEVRRLSRPLRWALVAAVLVLATAVAAWPAVRASGSGADDGGRPAPASAPDLDDLRETAALRPCPQPAADSGDAAEGRLTGVRVPCLGDAANVDLGAALAGGPALLNVWSHTCQPCRDELPVLDAYDQRPDSVTVLGIQVDGSPEAGLGMLAALGVQLPSVTDPDNALRIAVSAPPVLPLSYVVLPDGQVRMVNPPRVFESADEIATVVDRYLTGADGGAGR